MRKTLICGVLFMLCTANLRGGTVEITDDFHQFARERSKVALEDHSEQELWKIQGPTDDITCGHGILSLKGKPRSEIRLFSKQRFMYGTLTARLRYDTAGRGFNLYAGFANDDPWASSIAWIQNTDSRNGILLTGTNRKLNPVNQRHSTGKLPENRWFELKIVWQPESVELFIDGVSKGKAVRKEAIPSHPLPVLFCIYSPDKEYSMSIDRVHVIGTRPEEKDNAAGNFIPTPVSMPQMPAVPAVPSPQKQAAGISHNNGILSLENGFFRMRFDTAGSFKIKEFFNKYIQKNIIGQPGDFFAVYEKNARILPGNFKVTAVKITGDDEEKNAVITLKNMQQALVAELRMSVDSASPEVHVEMNLRHFDNKERKFQVVLPLLTNIRMGNDLKKDEFFYPFESGAAGDLDCEIHHPYGCTLFFPLMSFWNSSLGGGGYFYAKADDGMPLDLLVKKQSGKEFDGAVYKMIGVSPAGIFPAAPGIHMAIRHLEVQLKKGEKGILTPLAVGVHAGNFHEPLLRYSERARKVWFKKPFPTPQWYHDSFGFLSAHVNSGLHLLHPPQSAGFWDNNSKSFRYADQVSLKERNVVMEFCGLFYGNPEVEKKLNTLEKVLAAKLPVINAGNNGDYRYNVARGGLPLLRAEVERIKARGGRITLYTFPSGVAKGTKFEKLFGDKWAQMRSPGKYATNYTADGMGYNWCEYEEEFGEQLGAELAQVIKETGADGCRLDVMSRLNGCFNPKHSHYKGTLRSAFDPAGAGRTLSAFVRQAREANPEAIVTTEHGPSDYLCQFHDGYFSENIIWMGEKGMWEPYRALNMYGLVFQRFYFPEIKTWIHGPANRELALRMSLFNAVGYACSSSAGAVAIKTLEENGDAFNSMIRPTPLIPVLEKEVFANFFPGRNKRIWCIWNRSQNTLNKPVVKIDAKDNCRYVEVYNDLPVEVKDGALAPVLAPDTVGVVVEFPKVMDAAIRDGFLDLKINTPDSGDTRFTITYDADDYTVEPLYIRPHQGKAYIQLRDDYRKLIVKLYSGNYLIDEVIFTK